MQRTIKFTRFHQFTPNIYAAYSYLHLLGAKLCILAAKEKFRPAFIFCVKTFIFCELLFLCTLVCCIVSNLLGSNPMVLTFCIFVSLSILIAVFAANQFGLIWWPSVFWSTNNIANLYNPPIGAMS